MRLMIILFGMMLSMPAFGAGSGISLSNSNFVVLIAFLIFVGFLGYVGVYKMVGGMLDKRALDIRKELDEAKALRDEAHRILSESERAQRRLASDKTEMMMQAKESAMRDKKNAQKQIDEMIARRVRVADEKIESMRQAAVREVKNQAIDVAAHAASALLEKNMTAQNVDKLFNQSLKSISKNIG